MLDHRASVEQLLLELVEELLDAHDDTVCLVVDGAGEDRWAHHADYLRSLGRVGKGMLAALDVEH